ncbi:hypothetical protein CAPTEDRAFT_213482 [Capitella teleta]|uniref:Uncharacterized protein n=1 Tax=Capitella teleta TaxID=283909 RepID=R7TTX3_CAPTE|nr:hypothetical protein CAPTEDRAFT_213482 [Capitella teleta]|eukprot:ELT94465.1 hypothetical protein CAPTEDRAFT_213482 [Capitella teleta]
MSIREQPEFVPEGQEFVPRLDPPVPEEFLLNGDHDDIENDQLNNGELEIQDEDAKESSDYGENIFSGRRNSQDSVATTFIPFLDSPDAGSKPSRMRNYFPAMLGDHYAVMNTRRVDPMSRLRMSRSNLLASSQMSLSTSQFMLEQKLPPQMDSVVSLN